MVRRKMNKDPVERPEKSQEAHTTESVSASYEPESASTLPHAACATMARAGTFERGERCARARKNNPSRAIAYGTLEFASTLECNEPNEDTIRATAVMDTAIGPRKRFNTSVATEELVGTLAISSGDIA